MARKAMISLAKQAHPRRCGADNKPEVAAAQAYGSSPQGRGRFWDDLGPSAAIGLIPAGAGQMGWVACGNRQHRAHPRRCGADSAYWSNVIAADGSSPQVRADVVPISVFPFCERLIPAGAGQIGSWPSRVRRKWAHPRRCGADRTVQDFGQCFIGSSPQVRGRSNKHIFISPVTGLIPAGAGQMDSAVFTYR